MILAAVAANSESLAFHAYHALIRPALRDAACGPLRRARHNGRTCSGTDRGRLCDDCEENVDDHLLAKFTMVRKALDGDIPRTSTGTVVREVQVIVDWLTAPEAATTSLHEASRLIRQRPSSAEPAGVRAARAQLVHHPLQNLEARVRRAEAVAMGASARPERDLIQSAWAEPLRADPTAFALLLDAVTRLRWGGCDPYAISPDLLTRLNLDPAAAHQKLRGALAALLELRPDFYRANVILHMEQGQYCQDLVTVVSPESLFTQAETRAEARRDLAHLLAHDPRSNGHGIYRTLLGHISSPTPPVLPTWFPGRPTNY
ncbi:hypothetical protein [Thermocatellispora tengchongensis]|uniref:hypothetical protein n=1 Tax=Thermocatellispora tengchongensis TaxID=1073253 RepID=UPI0036404908